MREVHAAPRNADVQEQRVDRIEHQFAMLFDTFRARLRAQAAAFTPPLQPAAYRILLEVAVNGPLSAGSLADRLGVDKSALSRQLHQLEGLDLITRTPDEIDRRSIVVAATDAGVSRMQKHRTSARDAFRRGLTAWPAQDLEDLSRLLRALSTVGDETQ